MNQKYILITGSAGLIGSEATKFFINKGYIVIGIDNNQREYFFGKEASTLWNQSELQSLFTQNYIHHNVDIRSETEMEKIFQQYPFELIIHTAAQPSHDWAAKEPLTDFDINARATLILLELTRKYYKNTPFIYTSTNKVYGDNPNYLPLIELETRYEIDPQSKYQDGVDESMSIDSCKHSIFGVSKASADLMVQEYGRYFGLKTTVFRGGCLTGPSHSATKLHGFLAYLVKCIATGTKYTVIGYKGKQVRDNIHAADLVSAFYQVFQFPKTGEVYNIGGSRFSNISMREAIEKIEKILNKKAEIEYIDTPRSGDHIWYISDVSKFKSHYPDWQYQYNIDQIIQEICFKGHFK